MFTTICYHVNLLSVLNNFVLNEDDSLKYSKFMESLVKSFHYIK